jgi:hypothetical protein
MQPSPATSAYARAVTGTATTNYDAIFAGFIARGIPRNQIEPRVNVLTYKGWLGNGRQVRRGEHGVKAGGYSLFHVSQTDEA